ncbi:MAG: hypothetical protein ABIQ11_03090, partial [Saprospiraceae bacterium]
IDPAMILKTDPHHWITNFEPNYLAHIDFYEEDFLWRYTPLQPEALHRLKPWLALVVLKEDEFEDGKNILNRPLPYFTLKGGKNAADLFPKANQLWAWAHVHVNTDVVGATIKTDAASMQGVLDSLQQKIDKNADIAYSRLICPRKLDLNTAYHAFLIPAFESGRMAGLGDSAANVNAALTKIAWDNAAPVDFPIYYRWQFNTGTVGDFEYLVRILKPMPADLRVGRRDMDMSKPGANLHWTEASDLDLESILRLGGALQVPRNTLSTAERNALEILDRWGRDRFPHPFQIQIASLLNLADDYSYIPVDEANIAAGADGNLVIDPNEDSDPLITPPIYGRWHAMVERILSDRDGNAIHRNYNWITELNLDPRYRVPAHFGTRVVQQNQEDYMNAAWEQIGEVIKANRQIRYAQFAMAASAVWHQKYLVSSTAADPAKAFMLTAPVQSRILKDGLTVFQTVRESVLPNVALSTPMRRITRARGRFVKDLGRKTVAGFIRPEAIIMKIAEGKIMVAPPKTIAPGLPSASDAVKFFEPQDIPPFMIGLLRKHRWLPELMLILAVIMLLLLLIFNSIVWTSVAGIMAVVLISFYFILRGWKKKILAIDVLLPANQQPEIVDTLPRSQDFQLRRMIEEARPTIGGNIDSEDATRFKSGLRGKFELTQAIRSAAPRPVSLKPIAIRDMAELVVDRLNPSETIPAWTWQNIRIPDWVYAQMPKEQFTEAMAYPRFDLPMYKPLATISADLFLPNINLIEYNSITLLETNLEFIEAYMVGLNHEFGRELLWREYPTDQRGSYFRQFWDVSTLLVTDDDTHAGKTEEEIREMYRDIPKLHLWSRYSKLGSHDHRQKPGEPEIEEVVLVIRGELLKKYPNAVVYAHKANWTATSDTDATPDKSKPRSLFKEKEGDNEHPSFDVIRTPMYRAQIDPDISFFGFKLDVEEAKGDNDPETPTLKNAGWFFVIKERPGEPRFGFDIPKPDVDAAHNVTWNDVSWSEVLPGDGVIDALNPVNTISLPGPVPEGSSPEMTSQKNEDQAILWNANGHQVDAADLAYILYQVPVLVAVHASEMLPKNKN